MKQLQITTESLKGLVIRICGLGLMYLSTVLAANYLGAQQFGVFSSVLSLSPIWAAVAIGGVDIFATKTIAMIPNRKSSDIAQEISITHAVGLLGIFCAIILMGIVITCVSFYNWSEDNQKVLAYSMLIFPLTLLISIRQYISLPLMGAANAIFPEQVILPLLFCSSIFIAGRISSFRTADFVLVDYFVAAFLAWLIGWYMIRHEASIWKSLKHPLTWGSILFRLRCGRPFFITSIAVIIITNVVTVLVSFLLNLEAAGIFFAALRIAGLPYIPLGVIDQVVMPAAARFYNSGDFEGLSKLTRLATSLSFASGMMISFGILLLHKQILWLFGRDFQNAAPVLMILLVGQLINTITGPKVSLMRMVGLEKECSRGFVIASVILPFAVYVSARLGGVLMVAACLSLVIIVLNVGLCLILWKKRRLATLPYSPKLLLTFMNNNGWWGSSFRYKIKLLRQVIGA